MTECVFDTVLRLDFDDVQVVFLDDGANDVLRRRFIAKNTLAMTSEKIDI